MIGNLHKITKDYYMKKENTLNIHELKKMFNKCQNTNNRIFFELFDKLSSEIKFLEEAWPKKLPSGINHADLFKDNIFFKDGIISGVIDFYFSCYHFFIYDLSIAINEWSFQDNGKFFNKIYFKSIIEGYSLSRKLETEEIEAFNVVLRIATVRILVTRLYDYLFHTSDAFVVKKDPLQYFNILKWHQSNKVF